MTQYLKAFVGCLTAFLSSLVVVMVGDVGFGDITDGQWVVAVLAALGSLAAVWAVPNSEKDKRSVKSYSGYAYLKEDSDVD